MFNRKKKIVIGLTGSFGTGKTTVAGFFRSYGAKVIDADKIAHQVIRPGKKAYRKIVSVFGKGILKKDKSIDRAVLSELVFNKRNLLSRLNKIVHPEVIAVIMRNINASANKVIVLDAPLLIEAGLKKQVDKLIVVKATKSRQIERAGNRLSLSRAQIIKRIKCQIPLKNKLRLADFIIDNQGSIRQTKEQVRKIRRQLWRS
jgi:dephospho-CoA kinase